MAVKCDYDSKELQEFGNKLNIFSSKYDIGRIIYNRRIELKILKLDLASQTHIAYSTIEYIERVGNNYLVNKKNFLEKLNRIKLVFDVLDIKINKPLDYSYLPKNLEDCSIPLKDDKLYNNEIQEFGRKLNMLSTSYDIGVLIRKYRVCSGMMQSELACRVGVEQSKISLIERLGNSLLSGRKSGKINK